MKIQNLTKKQWIASFSYGLSLILILGFYSFDFVKNQGAENPPVMDTYTSFKLGNWTDGSTWEGNVAPPTILDNIVVQIIHPVTYDSGDDLQVNNGSKLEIRGGELIIPMGGSEPSISIGKEGAGTLEISGGTLDMQGQNGNLEFLEGGRAIIENSDVTVAENWKSDHESVEREFIGGCLRIRKGSFQNLGIDTYSNVCLDINFDPAVSSSGNWENNGTVTVGPDNIRVRCNNGNFSNSGTVLSGGGVFEYIFASSNIEQNGTWADAVKLINYCGNLVEPGDWPDNPAPVEDCSLENVFFPCDDCILSPTPVELSAFTGYKQDDSNLLKWETSLEVDNDYFEIQRSFDGRNFENIGQVIGSGQSTISRNYQFVDEQPMPFAYYRLKQVDFDGTFEYSSTISIERDKFNVHLTVQPSITSNEINLRINTLGDRQDYRRSILKIANQQGQVIYEEYLQTVNPTEYRTLQLGDQAPGMYYIFFQNQDDTYSTKFILIKE